MYSSVGHPIHVLIRPVFHYHVSTDGRRCIELKKELYRQTHKRFVTWIISTDSSALCQTPVVTLVSEAFFFFFKKKGQNRTACACLRFHKGWMLLKSIARRTRGLEQIYSNLGAGSGFSIDLFVCKDWQTCNCYCCCCLHCVSVITTRYSNTLTVFWDNSNFCEIFIKNTPKNIGGCHVVVLVSLLWRSVSSVCYFGLHFSWMPKCSANLFSSVYLKSERPV